MIAIALCLVMISTLAASVVSAMPDKQAGTSSTYTWYVHRYVNGEPIGVVGKVTVNLATGDWAIRANPVKAGGHEAKQSEYQAPGTKLNVVLTNTAAGNNWFVVLGTATFSSGTTLNGAGHITDPATLAWLATYGATAEGSLWWP